MSENWSERRNEEEGHWFWQKIYLNIRQMMEAFGIIGHIKHDGHRDADSEYPNQERSVSEPSSNTNHCLRQVCRNERILSQIQNQEYDLSIEEMLQPTFPLMFLVSDLDPLKDQSLIDRKQSNEEQISVKNVSVHSDEQIIESESSVQEDEVEEKISIESEDDSNISTSPNVNGTKIISKKSKIPRLIQKNQEIEIKVAMSEIIPNTQESAEDLNDNKTSDLHVTESSADNALGHKPKLYKWRPGDQKTRTILPADIKAAIVAKKRVQCPHCERMFEPKTCDVIRHVWFCEDIHKRIQKPNKVTKHKLQASGDLCDQQSSQYGLVQCQYCGRSFSERMCHFARHVRLCAQSQSTPAF